MRNILSCDGLRPFCVGFFAVACGVTLPPAAQAQIITSPSFNREVTADYRPLGPGSTTDTQSLPITSLPVLQSIAANDGAGGQITATYGMTDNGSVAQIDITDSGSVTPYNGLIEGGSGKADSFTLSEPVDYTAVIAESGPGQSELTLSGETPGTDGLQVFASGFTGAAETFSGVTGPGLVIFDENWSLSSIGLNSPPPVQSGGSTVTITFTAIPEPSSAALIGIPAVLFLARRRRSGLAGA